MFCTRWKKPTSNPFPLITWLKKICLFCDQILSEICTGLGGLRSTLYDKLPDSSKLLCC